MTRNNIFYVFRRIISVILTMSVFLMMTPVWGMTADSADIPDEYGIMPLAGGSGTQSDPYLIYTAQELNEYLGDGKTDHLGESFQLMGDIDLSWDTEWTPIGDYSAQFYGTFDGNGHTITVYISSEAMYTGLFGYNAGTIKNLGVKGTVEGTGTDQSAGGIAGVNFGEILQCYNSAYIECNIAGGIAGANFGQILHCYNKGEVNGTVSSGGIAGENYTISTVYYGNIYSCYNVAEVQTATNYGGIVGNNQLGAVSCCFFNDATDKGIGGIPDLSDVRGYEDSSFKSGEVAWLLQEGSDTYWGQTLGSDEYPVLKAFDSDAERVYKVEFYDGSSKTSTKYFNGILTELPAVTDRDGFKAEWRTAEDVGYTVGSAITGDIQLYLQWTAREVHTHDDGMIFEPWTYTDYLPDSGNYYLEYDVTLDRQCELSDNANTTLNLCLNGHTVTYNLWNPLIWVGSSNTLNIYDCKGNGEVTTNDSNTLYIASGGTANIYGGTFVNPTTYPNIAILGTVTIYGGTFESTNGVTISVQPNASLKITDGTFIRNNGGNVIQNQGKLEMSGGTVGRSGSSNGAVGIVNSGTKATATIKDVTITTEGTATDDYTKADKGLRNDNGGTMIVEDCNINSGNWAVWNTGGSTIKISGGTFNGRYGMYNDNGTFELSGSPTFAGSTADIYLPSGQKITVTNTLGNTTPYSVLTEDVPTAGNSVMITDSSTTLYNDAAKFTAADSRYAVRKNSSTDQLELVLAYTITYNAGSFGLGSVPSGTKTEGVDFTLSSDTFTRTGYIQTGWSTTDGGAKEYDLGGTYTDDADITLYPYWTECDHLNGKWGSWTYDETTHSHVCLDCGKTVTKEHSWDLDNGTVTKEPTCTEKGTTTYPCIDGCGATHDEIDVDMIPHDFSGAYIEDVNGDGHYRECGICGTPSNTVPHDWNEGTFTLGNCTTRSQTDFVCNSCGAEKTEYGDIVPDVHDWRDNGYNEQGHHLECSRCGETEISDHIWDEGTIDFEPTCVSKGQLTQHCTVAGCSETKTVEIDINPAAHKWSSEWESDENEHRHICENGCGETYPAGHTWNNGETTKPPTCTEAGEITFTCTECGYSVTETTEPKGHDFSEAWSFDENGHWHECSRDNVSGEITSHTEKGEITPPATETETGIMTYSCEVCGYVIRTEVIPATGTDTPPTGDNEEPSDGKDTGNITVDSQSGENAPDVSISGETSGKLKDEVIANHLTPEEKAAVADGGNLDIILMVEDAEDTVPAADKQATEAVLGNTKFTLGMYLNIDLIKLINGQQVGKITEINSPIRVTIEIPENMRNKNRKFVIVRVHNGVPDILEDVDYDPDTITIVTDKFSTYSIAYQDTRAANPGNPNTGTTTPISGTANNSSPDSDNTSKNSNSAGEDISSAAGIYENGEMEYFSSSTYSGMAMIVTIGVILTFALRKRSKTSK